MMLSWNSFWPLLGGMPDESRRSVGRELGGNSFSDWVKSRSPRVQIEVLEGAPEPIQMFFYPVLSQKVINRLELREPEITIQARIIDRRST